LFLLVCYCRSRAALSQWRNAFLEVRTTSYLALCIWGEPTLALLSEPIKLNVAIRLYADSYAGAVARAVAVVAFCFCRLEWCHQMEPL
jgi:hypothetical protein